MFSRTIGYAASAAMLLTLAACGGGGSSDLGGSSSVTAQSVSVPLMISDASTEDWSTIGVEILSVAFVPQGGGANVTVYTATSPVAATNLVQLDNLADVIGQPMVAAGTYTGAVVTVSANPGDVQLVTASAPEAGFPVAGGTAIPASAIQIQGATGSTGTLTVPIKVNFSSPITVGSGSTTPVDVEFDLSHPAFIVGHTPPANGGTTLWAVNFNGPVRHHPVADITALVLRHAYGNVSSVAADNSSITIARDAPTRPIVNPETATPTGQSLTILADAANGTLFYDVDARTAATIKDFSSVATSLPTKYVRVAARYQQNGTLVATRIWASANFNDVWISPEGHVAHVNAASNRFVVDNEAGLPVIVAVDASTEFEFHGTAAGTGPAFLASGNLVRGFKVHVSVVDPLATPLVAQTVDIETARYEGSISGVTGTGFDYTRKFALATDDYNVSLDFISANTRNGTDSAGAITGFKYWDFAFPAQVTAGNNVSAGQTVNGLFTAATTNAVNFGGTIGPVVPWGVSFATWGDPANAMGWSAPWVVLEPVPLPLGVVTGTAGLSASNTFTMTVPNAATLSPTIDVDTASGSATLVYRVDRSNGVVTVSPEDITTSAGLTALNNGLAVNAPVKVYGVPQSDGSLRAYVLLYYTGAAPSL